MRARRHCQCAGYWLMTRSGSGGGRPFASEPARSFTRLGQAPNLQILEFRFPAMAHKSGLVKQTEVET
jgi:hypothetical protein